MLADLLAVSESIQEALLDASPSSFDLTSEPCDSSGTQLLIEEVI